jgi:hypothetical protein
VEYEFIPEEQRKWLKFKHLTHWLSMQVKILQYVLLSAQNQLHVHACLVLLNKYSNKFSTVNTCISILDSRHALNIFMQDWYDTL